MRKIIHHTALWLIAFSIINTSIDVTVIAPWGLEQSDTHTSYYEIESIVEFVMDETSDHEDQLMDNHGNDQQSMIKKSVVFDFTLPVKRVRFLSPFLNNLHGQPSALRHGTLLPAGFGNTLIQPPDQV